jgi:acetolactate synthase I/II/III large subunit
MDCVETYLEEMMKVSDWIVQELLRMGVQRVYTLPGGFSMHLNDSIGHSALQPVYMLHESGAAFAACADAQYTGKISVVCVTSGPGCTNAITGITSAWLDSLPVLVISGDVRIPHLASREKYHLRQGGPQDAPIERMVKPIVKAFRTLPTTDGETLKGQALKEAFRHVVTAMTAGRPGPGWINVPLDVQKMEMER